MSFIAVENLSKTYRRGPFGAGAAVQALNADSLTVARGETLGIIGPNGAG